jgi:hypothetical protein
MRFPYLCNVSWVPPLVWAPSKPTHKNDQRDEGTAEGTGCKAIKIKRRKDEFDELQEIGFEIE